NPWKEAIKVAREIKQRMKKEVGDYLTCSIGIAENKLLAKIASDLQKPNGIVVVTGDTPLCHSESRRLGISVAVGARNPLTTDNRRVYDNQDIRDPSSQPGHYLNATLDDKQKKPLIFTKQDLYQKLKLTDIPG